MKVYVRHIDHTEAVEFTECKFSEFYQLLNFIDSMDGIYNNVTNENEPLFSWQLFLNNNKCAMEIIVGES